MSTPSSNPFQTLWIGSPVIGGPRSSAPAGYFRRTFQLPCAVAKATLAITALGVYEAEINGQLVSDTVLAPGWTDYRKRLLYQRYDVTALLTSGENTLGVILGDGWYCGYLGTRDRQFYGERPRFSCLLELTLSDGTPLRLTPDQAWRTTTGPILEADLLQGESYDARLELGPWSTPGYDDNGWTTPLAFPAPEIKIEPATAPPVRRIGELHPVSTTTRSLWLHQSRLFDLGQNFTGRVRISVEAAAGTTLLIRHGEMLDADGTLYRENLRGAAATDSYTCRGGGVEVWEPRFTFHGFRYVEVTGFQEGEQVDLTGVVLHSDLPETGYFACSHPLLNRLHKNILWSQKSNFLDVPTDCPQRDERLGWSGDAQIFIETACFHMDVSAFFRKWLVDLRDGQRPDGSLPPIAPDIGLPIADGGPGWSDAVVLCPWTLYLWYGDTAVLEENYDAMERYLDYVAEHRSVGYIRSHPDVDAWGGFGDWLALDGGIGNEGATPKSLIATAFYAHDALLMSKIAQLLDRPGDARRYAELHESVVAAFRQAFVTPAGRVASGTQSAYVLALGFGLIPEGEPRQTAARELARDIEARGCHLSTGFLGTPALLPVLEDHGYADLAYRLLEQESYPSWLHPVKNGATTIWERWDGWTPEREFQDRGMNSFNHYAYGAVGAWMIRSLGGLSSDPQAPGFQRILFRPRPGGSITWAETRLDTRHGEVAIHWRLEGVQLEVTLQIPDGASGRFSPPPGFEAEESATTELPPGTHRFSLTRQTRELAYG